MSLLDSAGHQESKLLEANLENVMSKIKCFKKKNHKQIQWRIAWLIAFHIFLCPSISFWSNICANRSVPIHIPLSFWCWQAPHLTLTVSAFYCHQRDVSSIIQWWVTIGDKEKDDIQRCLIVTLLIMLMLTKKMTSGENKEEKENLSIPVLVCPAHHLVHLHMYFWWYLIIFYCHLVNLLMYFGWYLMIFYCHHLVNLLMYFWW